MIKIENCVVSNIARSVYSARNAMNSWERSDSDLERDALGENDLALAKRLVRAGTDHSKFMRMINVVVDITAPRYWWTEFDTYKVGTVANSCSTMHKIAAKEFTASDFSVEHIGDTPNCDPMYNEALETILCVLNEARHCFLDTKDKSYWWQMIQLLPQSYNQLRTVSLNYAVLQNMYRARKDHKLDEWHTFCEWAETLPYFKELVIDD